MSAVKEQDHATFRSEATPTADEVLGKLRAMEAELRAAGVNRASLFGSVARGEASPSSDVDVALHFPEEVRAQGLAFIETLLTLSERLKTVLERPVDVISEPVRRASFARNIEKDRIIAFG